MGRGVVGSQAGYLRWNQGGGNTNLFNKHMEGILWGRQRTGDFSALVSMVKHFNALRNQTFILSAIFQLRNVQTRHLHLISQPHPLVHLQP